MNDILDLERLESGKLRIQKQPCQTQNLIETAVQEMQDLANRANVTISPSGISYSLQADPDRIVQVLTNLLSNAIRFSNAGNQVWVSVGEVGEVSEVGEVGEADGLNAVPPTSPTPPISPTPPTPSLLFSVQDQGRGIPAEKLEYIFERFQQSDASDSREKERYGFGLNHLPENYSATWWSHLGRKHPGAEQHLLLHGACWRREQESEGGRELVSAYRQLFLVHFLSCSLPLLLPLNHETHPDY